MQKSRFKMRNQEQIFDPSRLAEIPIVAVISTPPPPAERRSRLLPSAHHKYVLTASFPMIPEPDVARLLNNYPEAACWPPPQLPSCQALLKDTPAYGTDGPSAHRQPGRRLRTDVGLSAVQTTPGI